MFTWLWAPLTWVAEQKDDFKKYLMQHDPKDEISFSYKQKEYRIRITGVDVFPQSFAAIVSHLADFKGVNMLCDIGNGNMNVMTITNPDRMTGRHTIICCTWIESNSSPTPAPWSPPSTISFPGGKNGRPILTWKPGKRKIVFCGRCWTSSTKASGKI